MTPQNELLKLAERCEAATGPDRELDESIARAVGWKREGFSLGKGIYDPTGNWHMTPPRFTASLDAAMTLVPEGWRVAEHHETLDAEPTILWRLAERHAGFGRAKDAQGRATTSALALTAACLRARANQASPQQGDGE